MALLGRAQRTALLESTPRSTELGVSVVSLRHRGRRFDTAGPELDSPEARAEWLACRLVAGTASSVWPRPTG